MSPFKIHHIEEQETNKNDNQNAQAKESMAGKLALDIYDNENEIVIFAPVAGCGIDDVQVSFEQDSLTISGIRPRPNLLNPGFDALIEEVYWGEFSRNVILPEDIDKDNINAEWKENLLVIHIPKVSERKIHIKEIE